MEPEQEWQKLWQQMQKDFHTPTPDKRKIKRRVWYSMAAGVCVLMTQPEEYYYNKGKRKNQFLLWHKLNTWEKEALN